ncbi:MAG: hypothetical protein JZU52_07475 [Lamprocystis purpurea]|jgi:antitoxin MazE|uniref:AbrB/MazE/SpoVT family DNA-binding domain-containing protein n=1 Tax=Lamprocystis purpurea TaxID=61598 RepID=UPI0003691D77|nr:hypothetical protein [Lamprocystis purpurea]MBV5273472.1 hypothetical protein [Lamprocystis purpurea]
MRTTLRKIGNAHGALIPKALLAQTGIDQAVELTVEDGAIANEDALRKTQRHEEEKRDKKP